MRWRDIVREYGPRSYQTAWRILRHEQDCEDVLQDVFLEAYPLFQAGKVKYWRTFLNRLVTFRSLDSLRRRKEYASLEQSSVVDRKPGSEQAVIELEQVERIRSLVAQLPQQQAAVFCLAHFEELSHAEIAESLEISKNAVSLALFKARATLQERFTQENKECER